MPTYKLFRDKYKLEVKKKLDTQTPIIFSFGHKWFNIIRH